LQVIQNRTKQTRLEINSKGCYTELNRVYPSRMPCDDTHYEGSKLISSPRIMLILQNGAYSNASNETETCTCRMRHEVR